MPEQFQSHVVVCWPSSREEIDRLAAAGKVAPFVPTVEHSLSTCDGCGQSVWIGQPQLELVKFSVLRKTRKLCMVCAAEVQRTLKLKPVEIDIGVPLRDARPRR